MPDNPEQETTLVEQVAMRWYWFTNSHKMSDILAALFLGIIIGLWVS